MSTRVIGRDRAQVALGCALVVAVLASVALAGPVRAADSEAVWLPQPRQVRVSAESLGYPAEPEAPAGASTLSIAPADAPVRPTDRRSDSNWRLRPVNEMNPSERSTIPGEDALNRPTALRLKL